MCQTVQLYILTKLRRTGFCFKAVSPSLIRNPCFISPSLNFQFLFLGIKTGKGGGINQGKAFFSIASKNYRKVLAHALLNSRDSPCHVFEEPGMDSVESAIQWTPRSL